LREGTVVVGQALRLPVTDAVALQLVHYATRPRQFFGFFRCRKDIVRCDWLLVLNVGSGGSVDSPEVSELSGSVVSKIWEV
jgi:hypothetical protein